MRLLLIEDDLAFGKSVKGLLEDEGYAVDWAQNGSDGLKRGRFEDYDLAVVDIGLPDMSGLEVVKQLRATGFATPTLFLTALGQLKDKVQGLDAGADDYVVKPVLFDELLARLRSLLRRPPVLTAANLTCQDLTMDLAARRVTRGKTEIELSLKEFALLEYLLRQAGRTVSRQELIDHVWDSELDSFSNTVDVHIGYLRKKIDQTFPKRSKLIKTVRGIGYTLQQ